MILVSACSKRGKIDGVLDARDLTGLVTNTMRPYGRRSIDNKAGAEKEHVKACQCAHYSLDGSSNAVITDI